ncbi:hypothetical protein K1719_000653 [Acacia pycnantha]|nr:hypothetical protein K1719_000653 [Acacia pycnantha]
MAWNSVPLHISYEAVGWLVFTLWSISFYPQVILNYRRKSVVGLNFDFEVLNLTKHTCYLIYNASLYFSSTVQKQYKDKYGQNEMIPVAANDVAFSSHAVLLTAFTIFQIAIYDRGNQKVSKIACGILFVAWPLAAICFFIALSNHHWLWLLSILSGIQVFMTVIKYLPQAVMNFRRKSTEGWSIGNILLDFSGSIGNYSQMVIQSKDQGSWANFSGNIGKLMISLVSVFYNILFMIQHYVLYRPKKVSNSETPPPEVEINMSTDKPLEAKTKIVEDLV